MSVFSNFFPSCPLFLSSWWQCWYLWLFEDSKLSLKVSSIETFSRFMLFRGLEISELFKGKNWFGAQFSCFQRKKFQIQFRFKNKKKFLVHYSRLWLIDPPCPILYVKTEADEGKTVGVSRIKLKSFSDWHFYCLLSFMQFISTLSTFGQI